MLVVLVVEWQRLGGEEGENINKYFVQTKTVERQIGKQKGKFVVSM